MSYWWVGINLMLVCLSAWAKLSVTAEPLRQTIDAPIEFTITQEDSKGLPNLVPLKQDFTIVGTEQSSYYQIINGQTSAKQQWVITLMAKKTGQLIIPAITLGQEHTKPLTVHITKPGSITHQQPSAQSQNQAAIKMTATLDTKEAFSKQQMLYTVKLYNRLNLIDANYTPPAVDNGLLLAIGEGRRYQTAIEGELFAVNEQVYAFFPQQAGKVTIRPPIFQALSYDMSPKPLKITAPQVTATIKAPPVKLSSWLPAKKVWLDEQTQWPDTIKQGETFSRELTLKAVGLPAQMLPKLSFNDTKAYSVYSDKIKDNNTYQHHNVIGQRHFKVTYVCHEPGVITLPAIKLEWFNTQTQQNTATILPAKTLTVTAAPPAPGVSASSPKMAIKHEGKKVPSSRVSFVWPGWILAAIFALGWFMTWFKMRAPKKVGTIPKRNRTKATDLLKNACYQNDPKAAKAALFTWMVKQFPDKDFRDITDLKALNLPQDFINAIDELLAANYSKAPSSWSGDALWRCVSTYKPFKAKASPHPTLPSLYPDK